MEGYVSCDVLYKDPLISLHNPILFSEEVPGFNCVCGCSAQTGHGCFYKASLIPPLPWPGLPSRDKCSFEKVSLGIMDREKYRGVNVCLSVRNASVRILPSHLKPQQGRGIGIKGKGTGSSEGTAGGDSSPPCPFWAG